MSNPPLSLDYVYRWEKEMPDRLWMTQPIGRGDVVTYTWAEGVGQARRMAMHLKSLGLPPGSSIAILSKNCAHFIMCDLAIWMAGHVSVALCPTLNADTVRYILEHSESKVLFVGKLDGWDQMKAGVPPDMPRIALPLAPPNDYEKWDDIVGRTQPLAGEVKRDPSDAAVIVYTSGSTGRPKGATHSFGAIAACMAGAGSLLDNTKDDRMLSYLPLAHVFERAFVEHGTFQSGFQLFFAESLDTFLHDLNRARPTLFISVPRLWLKFQLGVFKNMPPAKLDWLLKIPILNRIVKKKVLTKLGLDKVRIAGSGSAPIPPELIQWYRNLGLELLEGYGMSEDLAYSHLTLPGQGRAGYVGQAMPGVDVKISEQGEILIKSPGNMIGYYKEPEMTAACYTDDGYFKTGDRGERDEHGRLKITGRVKEIFKTSKGKYVAPAPIENIINTHSKIEMCCVTGSGQAQPFCLILPAEDIRPHLTNESARERLIVELNRLLDDVNDQVEHHEQLQFFAIVKDEWLIENGMLTPTMKLKRATLEGAYAPKVEGWYSARERIVWET